MHQRNLTTSSTGQRAALALTLACALPLAACGDGTEPDPTAAPTAEAPEDSTDDTDTGGDDTTDDTDTADGDTPDAGGQDGTDGQDDATDDAGGEATDDDGQDATTEVVALQVFGEDGYPTADWTIQDRSEEAPFDCWAMSGAVLEGLGYMCGASVDYGVGCLDNPLAVDEVICVTDPIAQEGYRHKVGERPTGERTQFIPLAVQVADGGVFRMRSGGAGAEDPDGLVEFFFCHDRCDGTSLWGVAGEDGVNHDTEAWTALLGPEDGSQSAHEVPVTRAWMLVGTGID